ncbi:phosphatidylinositol 4-phosphate 5-kinase 10-like [Carica papaya]|uniref:phosphatidylinositol 4-phosphate 5-kinase 10-like n=1 Tax=Carica papaya TaxID=3649 RepID=UPI000B8D0F1C|nr:phosphatidylinositol 4-phosphate 5-kinase 10-like [Carica papaya]
MDYSLLLGFHVKGSTQGLCGPRGLVSTDSLSQGSISSRGSIDEKIFSRHFANRSSVSIRTSSISSVRASIDSRSSCPDSSMLENEEKEFNLADSWLPKSSSPFGLKVPALAVPISRDKSGSISHRKAGAQQYYNVSLYFEIVDIFQNYGVRKRIERAYKSLQYNSKSISAINPKAYAVRFQDFLTQIFQADESDDLSSPSENGNLDEVAGS